MCFSSFLDKEPKIFGLLANFSRQNFENYILRVHKNNLRTFCKKNLFPSFLEFKGKKLRIFPESIGGFVKTAFYLSTGTFRGVFYEKVPFYHFGTLLESCPTSSGKVSTGLWIFVTTCPEKHSEEKRFFSQKNDFFRNRQSLSENFSVIVENISAGLPKLICECPLGTFSRKELFLRKNLFHLNFANRARKFLPFVEVY